MLKMTDIHKSFGELEVLKGIDFSVAKGDVLAIIGPSGSGKSTMLRCINRLEEIDSGKIEIMGCALAENGADGRAEYVDEARSREILACTGMVFQQFNLFPHMTVMENLLEAPVQVKSVLWRRFVQRQRSFCGRLGFLTSGMLIPADCLAVSSSEWLLPEPWL